MRLWKSCLLVTAALSLSGCAIFGHKSALGEMTPDDAALAKARGSQQEFTLAGRRELDAGNTGAAIEAFERALAMGEDAAPALNGMGVAYARLGRYDAAQRFFQQAMILEPTEEKYAANMARLMRSPAFAMRYEGDAAAQLAQKDPQAGAQAEQAVPAVADAAPAPAAPQPGRLVRVAAKEFHIQTAAAQPAPARSAMAALDARFKPLVRMELASVLSQPEDAVSLESKPRVVNISGFKPLVRVNFAPDGGAPVRKAGRR